MIGGMPWHNTWALDIEDQAQIFNQAAALVLPGPRLDAFKKRIDEASSKEHSVFYDKQVAELIRSVLAPPITGPPIPNAYFAK